MSAKFTNSIRYFMGNALLNLIESKKIKKWTQSVYYSIGDKVENNSNIYVAASSGTSGSNAPIHTSGIQSDGSVQWIYVEPAIKGKIFESNLYLSIGRKQNWKNPQVPDAVIATDLVESDVLKNTITLKRLIPENMRICAKRNNWISGNVYDQYDDEKEFTDYIRPFYVINSNNDIFVCLDNFNNSPSNSEPTNTSTSPFRTIDGYVWKYIGSVDANDHSSFSTDEFIPVRIVHSSHENPNQWAVQQSAQPGSISTFKIIKKRGIFINTPVVTIYGNGTGAMAGTNVDANGNLNQVYIVDSGRNYTKGQTYAIVTDGSPQGSGAVANAIIDQTTGSITEIQIVNGGSGYSSGAIALIVGVPKPNTTLTEPTDITVNVVNGTVSSITLTGTTLNYESASVYIIPGNSGAVAYPVMAPSNGHGENIIKELGASTVMISTKLTNTVNDTGYFLVGTGSDFHQISLITDIVDKSTNEYCTENNYIGPGHPQYNDSTSTLNKINDSKGIVLYIDNITTITRSSNQEEEIKIAITL